MLKACRLDIPKFCKDVFKDRSPKDAKMEGRIIDCLKKSYALKKKVGVCIITINDSF